MADKLLGLAWASGVETFKDETGRPYLTFAVGDHREHHPVRSQASRLLLQRLSFEEFHKLPDRDCINAVLEQVEAEAMFESEQHNMFVRVAEHEGSIYLDLGDPSWQAVRITRDDWDVVSSVPVKFRRPNGLKALPLPVRGGSLDELRPFLNLPPDSNEFVLIVAWLLGALRGRGPYSCLVFNGEQGGGKSTATRVAGRLLDPSACELRGEPHDVRDLMIASNNGHAIRLDNLSTIRPWLSDALCRLATGGGFATRELYSDSQELLINVQRPVIVNSIVEVVVRPDLLDRSIVIRLPHLSDGQRKTEREFWTDFDEAQPRILGALLDAAVVGLQREDSVQLDAVPRMADFARWVVAAEPALPWQPGDFLRAYRQNRVGAVQALLDGDAVADAVRDMGTWCGTATDLLNELQSRGARVFTPRQAAAEVRRLAPALRQSNIEVNFEAGYRHGGQKLFAIFDTGTPAQAVRMVTR